MLRYVALDPINYASLKLNQAKLAKLKKKDNPGINPESLVQLCATAICKQGTKGAEEAILSMPGHLATTLLSAAIHSLQPEAIAAIIANWPLSMLCFRDVLQTSIPRDIFAKEMGLDLIVFKGVTSRTRKCRMTCLDLRGLELNFTFVKLIVQMWPLLSLKTSQRNIKRLTRHVLKAAGLKSDIKLVKEIIPKLLGDLLGHEMSAHPTFSIHMYRGEKLTVQIDKVEFSSKNTFFMDYLLTSCLRSVTPVTIIPTNIVIKSELNLSDEILDSMAPFIVFRGHDTESVEGVWLENLEENVFFIFCQDLNPFHNVKAAGFTNCNIMLQEGRTRRRTSARRLLTDTLTHFPLLVRLDISQNSFAGCLQELLDALPLPLEYLSLRECDLVDRDLLYLSESRHAVSLKQLNLSKVCGLFADDNFAIATETMVRTLKRFRNLSLVHLQQNQLTRERVHVLCGTIANHWPTLTFLNVSDNILPPDDVIRIIRAACGVASVQSLKVPYAHNMLQAVALMETARRDFMARVEDVLVAMGRPDVAVDVQGLGYAVFGNV